MRHIKLFENFNTPIQKVKIESAANSIKNKFDVRTSPEKPIRRKLTDEEKNKMNKYFFNYSWSNVDNLGRVILGGGEADGGMYYINIDDLSNLP
jgi:hypothetical protein